VVALDSRFRGNDWRLEWIPIPNDTSTQWTESRGTDEPWNFSATYGTLGASDKRVLSANVLQGRVVGLSMKVLLLTKSR